MSKSALFLLATFPLVFASGWSAWGASMRTKSLPGTLTPFCTISSHDDTKDDTWTTAGKQNKPPRLPRSNSLPDNAKSHSSSKNFYPSEVLPSRCQTFVELREYASCLNHGSPSWVVENLEIGMMGAKRDRTQIDFKPHSVADRDAESKFAPYQQTAFDRGHLAPAAHHSKNLISYQETFYLPTNAVPQYRTMNHVDWTRLEDFIFHLLTQSTVSNAYVVTGTIYNSDFQFSYSEPIEHFGIPKARAIGDIVKIDVPSHMYKIVKFYHALNGKSATSAFVIPNQLIKQEYPIAAFEVPLSEVEQATTFADFSAMKSSKTLCSVKKSLCTREFSTDDRATQRYVDWMSDRSPKELEELASFVKHAIKDKLHEHGPKASNEKPKFLRKKYHESLSVLKNRLEHHPSPPRSTPVIFFCEELVQYEPEMTEDVCQEFLSKVFV